MKKLGKKGIIFTLIAIVLSAIVLTTYFFQQSVPIDKSVDSTQLRIKSVNSYIEQLDTYIPLQAEFNGRAAFKNMTRQMIIGHKYLKDFDKQFDNCMKYGSFQLKNKKKDPVYECPGHLQGSLLALDILARDELNINSNLTLLSIYIYQIDPWHVLIQANVSINVTDGFAEWHFNKTFVGNMSILGLPDPTPEIDKKSNKRGPPKNFTTRKGILWVRYPSDLNILALDGHYFAYDYGPNYLSRLDDKKALKNIDIGTGIASYVLGPPRGGGKKNDKDIGKIANTDFSYWQAKKDLGCPLYTLDFFSNINVTERSKLGINETGINSSINSTVIPENLLNQSNLNNPDYITNRKECPVKKK